jgi:hypothetical protein
VVLGHCRRRGTGENSDQETYFTIMDTFARIVNPINAIKSGFLKEPNRIQGNLNQLRNACNNSSIEEITGLFHYIIDIDYSINKNSKQNWNSFNRLFFRTIDPIYVHFLDEINKSYKEDISLYDSVLNEGFMNNNKVRELFNSLDSYLKIRHSLKLKMNQ